MQHQFNIQQLYALPTLYLCVLYLSENKLRLVQFTAKTDWFYSRDEKCLQRGTVYCFLLHDGEHPSSTLDKLLTHLHSHHISVVC